MILILLALLSVVVIVLAVIADKRKAKFFFGMHPDESIHSSADSVKYYVDGRLIATTGILYVTNMRVIFFKYRSKALGFIPFIGSMLEAIFIDKNQVFDISLADILYRIDIYFRYDFYDVRVCPSDYRSQLRRLWKN